MRLGWLLCACCTGLQEALRALTAIALELSQLQRHTGRNTPTVIT